MTKRTGSMLDGVTNPAGQPEIPSLLAAVTT
jgi:hypothetical protein